MVSWGGQGGLASLPQVGTHSSVERQEFAIYSTRFPPTKEGSPTAPPISTVSLPTAWHPKQPGLHPCTPCGPSPGDSRMLPPGCLSPWLLSGLPQADCKHLGLSPPTKGGYDGCAHKSPAETIGQECISFRTNTVWARTIALDSHPRNTFRCSRARVACLPQPAHTPFYARDFDESAAPPHPLQGLPPARPHSPPPWGKPASSIGAAFLPESPAWAENGLPTQRVPAPVATYFNHSVIVIKFA